MQITATFPMDRLTEAHTTFLSAHTSIHSSVFTILPHALASQVQQEVNNATNTVEILINQSLEAQIGLELLQNLKGAIKYKTRLHNGLIDGQPA